MQTKGILIRSYPSGESNLVVRFITADFGKLVGYAPYAKRSQKRFGRLDLFDYGQIDFTQSDSKLEKLKEFKTLSSFPKIRESLDKVNIASFLAELFDIYTPENDPHSNQNFKILFEAYSSLDNQLELNEELKICHQALYQLLIVSGVSNLNEHASPSVKHLISILQIAQKEAEKEIKLSTEILKLIDRYQATH